MADYLVKGESLTAVAEAIREKTGTAELMTLGQMPDAIRGIPAGGDGGCDQGYEAGKQAEHDAFWDAMQQHGARRNYNRAFTGIGWTKENFRPKYDIIVTGTCQLLFADSYNDSAPTWDLAANLEECGVTLDFSQATDVSYAFNYTNFTRIGVCDFSGATYFASVFGTNYKLVTIDKIIMPKKQTSGNLGWFGNSSGLENVTFEGEIMLDGMNMSSCTKLTHDSLMSIVNHLKDYSGTGTTRTLTLGTANLEKLTTGEKMIAVNKGWTLVGWTPPAEDLYCGCGAPLDGSGVCTEMNSPGCEGWVEE